MFSHINYHSWNRHQTFRVWRLFKLYEEAWVLADLLPVRPRSSITPEAGSLIARDYLSQVCRVERNSGKPLKTDHIWIPFNPLAETLSAGCFGERESRGGVKVRRGWGQEAWGFPTSRRSAAGFLVHYCESLHGFFAQVSNVLQQVGGSQDVSGTCRNTPRWEEKTNKQKKPQDSCNYASFPLVWHLVLNYAL